MSNTIYKTYVEKLGGTSASNYVGTAGDLFYDPETTTLRISNGTSAGGTTIGGGAANTGNITFSSDVIGHVDGAEAGIRLRPNDPSIKMFVDSDRSWNYSVNGGYFTSGEWVIGEGYALVLNSINLEFSDLFNSPDLQNRKRITAIIRSQGTQVGELTVTGFSSNGPDNVAYMYVPESPGEQPVYFDEIEITTVFENRVVLDDDEGDFGIWTDYNINLNARNDITLYCSDDLRMTGNDVVALRNRSAEEPVQIIANYDNFNGGGQKTWAFYPTGELQFDTFTEQGDARGRLQWIPNSSGDGIGYTTLELTPDANLETDQKIILDPTAPNHIHIRAGGTQDNSSSSLYLGGENSHVEIPAGENPPVNVRANGQYWQFTTNGEFVLPGAITFNDGSQQTAASISIVNLKTLVAAAADFDAFKTAIAAL